MINTTTLIVDYTFARSTPWTNVVQRLIDELSGAYTFGTPRVTARSDDSVTISVDAVKRGES